MRALLGGTGAGGGVDEPVTVTVAVDGEVVEELAITPETADVFRLVDLRPYLRSGRTRVALAASGQASLAYQIVATHYLPEADVVAGEDQALSIAVAYDRTTLATDDLLGCVVTIAYNRPGVARMTLVDLGLPPGFEVVSEGFDRLVADGVIARYSLTGRQATLYFDAIAGGVPVEFRYELRAKYPVRAKAPAAVVYQYYQPELRAETRPVEITVN